MGNLIKATGIGVFFLILGMVGIFGMVGCSQNLNDMMMGPAETANINRPQGSTAAENVVIVDLSTGTMYGSPEATAALSEQWKTMRDETESSSSQAKTAESTAPSPSPHLSQSSENALASNPPKSSQELKPAAPGVTGRGQYTPSSEYNPMSIITVPVATYFKTQELSVFNITIPQALELFRATYGSYPNSTEEFYKQVILANKIVLPALQPGDYYVYDPENHQLNVQSFSSSSPSAPTPAS